MLQIWWDNQGEVRIATFVLFAGHSLNLVDIHAADAVRALHEGHKQIKEALISIAKDIEHAQEIRKESLCLYRKVDKLEYIILTEIWSSILERTDEKSNYLQKEIIILDVANNMFTALNEFVISLSGKFGYFQSSAQEKIRNLTTRTFLKKSDVEVNARDFFDGSAPLVRLNGKERFKPLFP